MAASKVKPARIAVVGTSSLGHNLGLVLRGHGRHQAIRVAETIPSRVLAHFDDPLDRALNPDPETRDLLEDGPLPTTDLVTALHYSDLVYLAVQAWRVPDLLKRIMWLQKPGWFPLPQVVWLTDGRVSWDCLTRALLPQQWPELLRGYQYVETKRLTRATDLCNPTFLHIQSDHPRVIESVEQIWRPIINTVPVRRGPITP